MTRPPATTPVVVFALAVAAAASGEERLVDSIAAQVGTEVVLVSDVSRVMEPLEARMQEMGATPAELARMRADLLERLVERSLISQFARRAEIDASEAEIDAAVATIAKDNRLTLEQLRASVEAQGLPFEAYRQRMREEIVYQKVIGAMVQPHVHLEEAELRALYRQRFGAQRREGQEVHLRHLLVTSGGGAPAARRAACATVGEALARVHGGEAFEDVAAELSEANPARGGDLGWLPVDELAGWMVPVVRALAPGQVSGVVETSFGCNLLQLVERRETRPVGYEEARPALRAELYEQRFAEEFSAFIEKLRSQTYIERKGLFAEAARLGGSAAGEPKEGPQGP